MSLISRKVDYGILVLFHLMRHGEGSSARELAAKYGLSRAFIANILKELCHAGFVESHRGVHGGYRLAKEPSEITIRDVIAKLDGQFQLMACASTGQRMECELAEICPVRNPLHHVHERLLAVLGAVSLETLAADDLGLVSLGMETMPNG
jgi:Rrf2 family protein